jgi:glycerol kinase
MILAIDQGTTATTCIVFDERGEPIGRAQAELSQSFPRPGWVEHDMEEIWELVQGLAGQALRDAGVAAQDVIAIGITNQRETVCAWDVTTGRPLHSAIVWQDRRTSERCAQLRAQGLQPLVRQRTGLVLDPYFSATKMQWLLENVEGLAQKAKSGRAMLGTVDSWLAFKLTGEHVTDPSNAARTLLYDLADGDWSEELLDLFGVPRQALPQIRPSAGAIATVRGDALAGISAPLAGIAGDQQAALFGQACVDPGMGKNTYGTGSFVLLHAGFSPPDPADGLLSTVGWGIGQTRSYALEASIFATGAAVQWLRDGLGIIAAVHESEALAASLSSNDGVYFVPALTGLGSPHWDPDARGTIVGLTRGTGAAHLARAALEAIAYQTVDAVRAMERACGQPLRELRADGGATANRWLMQFQADILGVPVLVPEIAETTALGAALLAGVGVGAWSISDVGAGWRERARYEPSMSGDEGQSLLAGWQRALARTRSEGVEDAERAARVT